MNSTQPFPSRSPSLSVDECGFYVGFLLTLFCQRDFLVGLLILGKESCRSHLATGNSYNVLLVSFCGVSQDFGVMDRVV